MKLRTFIALGLSAIASLAHSAGLPPAPALFKGVPTQELAALCYGTLYRAAQSNELEARQAPAKRAEDLYAYSLTYAVASQIALVRALRAASEVPRPLIEKAANVPAAELARNAVYCSKWSSNEHLTLSAREKNDVAVRMEQMYNGIMSSRLSRPK